MESKASSKWKSDLSHNPPRNTDMGSTHVPTTGRDYPGAGASERLPAAGTASSRELQKITQGCDWHQ